MPDCDYCSADFDSEDAYLDHLDAEHYDELSRIDRRRVDQRASESGLSTTQKALVVGLGVPVLLVAGLLLADVAGLAHAGDVLPVGSESPPPATTEGDVIPEGIESAPLQDSGDESLLQDVETYQHTSAEHLPRTQDPDYQRIPPTGGDHYSGAVRPGFYEQRQVLGDLVHNLEHGHVVIYYDPAATSPAAEASLKAFADNHQGRWSAVVVAPNPRENPQSDYVLTAWGARLRMDGYDARVVKAFIDEYIGRGPENPVR